MEKLGLKTEVQENQNPRLAWRLWASHAALAVPPHLAPASGQELPLVRPCPCCASSTTATFCDQAHPSLPHLQTRLIRRSTSEISFYFSLPNLSQSPWCSLLFPGTVCICSPTGLVACGQLLSLLLYSCLGAINCLCSKVTCPDDFTT